MIVLPWPPSTNTIWRRVGNRTLLSKPARQFREAVCERATEEAWPKLGEARVAVVLIARSPDRRRYDIDGRIKAALDALTHAGVWSDDEQVDALTVLRGTPTKGGELLVSIEPIKTEVTPRAVACAEET